MVEPQDMSSYLVEKKIEIIMNQGMKKIVADLDALRQEVSALRSEVDNLNNKVRRMDMPASSHIVGARTEEMAEGQERPAKKLTVGAGPGAQQIDPSQFSVEKIFYSAGKGGMKKRQ